ncbi:MAG: CoA transferase [Candidatus Rokubacteria bacterium]|nr:CoA transferase [Candidatus Rokubacteria bacterium]
MKVHDSYFQWAARLFDPAWIHEKPEALRGIRVLDLSVIIFGPATADFLGELGAEVIKVEMPGQGDVTRILGGATFFWKNISVAFFGMNHSKYHVGIDMHKPEGQELIRKLAARSDILVENFKAGTLEEKFGIGYRQLREVNPRLIYVANTGFGQWGPFARGRASYDGLAQAVSGLTAITGEEGELPTKIGNYIGDWFGACMAALGALAALRWRDRTGEGQFVEMAQCEGLLRAMDWTWLYAGLTGKDRLKTGNRDPLFSPSGVYRCTDGYVAVVAGTDAEFRGLCGLLGQPELARDPRFESPASRREKTAVEALDRLIAAWCEGRTRVQIEAEARQHGVPAAPVMTARDHYESAHFRARRSVWEHEDPVYGTMVEYGPAPKLSATPARIKWAGKPVGFHNEFVLKKLLGLTDGEVRELEAKKVIGKWADRLGAKPPDAWKGEGLLQ